MAVALKFSSLPYTLYQKGGAYSFMKREAGRSRNYEGSTTWLAD